MRAVKSNRTFHVLQKADILICYEQEASEPILKKVCLE